MRKLLRFIPLVLLAVMTSACDSSSQNLIFGPPINVTPITAPITVTTDGTPVVVAQASPEAIATSGEDATATPADAEPTIAIERTPVRIKVPAEAPPQPTQAPLPTDTPVESPISELPTDTPSPVPAQDTPPPADTPTPEPLPTEAVVTEPPTPEPATNNANPTTTLNDTLNILVVGSDERSHNGPWRSDVIMVVGVDFANRQIGVVSFPRDLWVGIPTVGDNRINTATFFGEAYGYKDGGIGLLQKTLEENFGLRIDHVVKINFDSFRDLVDALGGIDVTVDCPISGRFPREPGSQTLVYQTLEPGEYHMDGTFALRYARERKSTSDVDRTRRQQRVLIAVRNRAREVNIIPRLPALYDALRDTIETDLGLTDILALARLGLLIEPKDAHGFIIGFQQTKSWVTPEGAMVLLPETAKIDQGIANLFAQPSILESPNKPRSCQDE